MEDKYYPYELISDENNIYIFQIVAGYKSFSFFINSVLPFIIAAIILLIVDYTTNSNDFGFGVIIAAIGLISIILCISLSINQKLVFTDNSIIITRYKFFNTKDLTFNIEKNSYFSVQMENGRSRSYVFYLVTGENKQFLFPISLSKNGVFSVPQEQVVLNFEKLFNQIYTKKIKF
jgi:hypothetical protein